MKKLLKFETSTCQPCKVMDKTLAGMGLEIPVEKINYTKDPDLFDQYGVSTVPTLVLLPSGKKLMGAKSPAEIREWLEGA